MRILTKVTYPFLALSPEMCMLCQCHEEHTERAKLAQSPMVPIIATFDYNICLLAEHAV